MRALGIIYESGLGVDKDPMRAFDFFQKGVEAGNTKSLEKLAWYFEKGVVVEKNEGKAKELYERFFTELQKQALDGDADAMYRMGDIYQYGFPQIGIPIYYQQAAEWYEKAANKGYMYAQTSLGILYYFGQGVPKNYTKAAEWYKKAAEQGDATAIYNLAGCYRLGRGVEQNEELAAMYNQKAANMDMPEAQAELGGMYYLGTGVEQDYTMAVHWFKRAVANGYENAYYGLGCCYYKGLGIEKSRKEAFRLFELGEKRGDRYCMMAVAECCIEGQGTPTDYVRAMRILEGICGEYKENQKETRYVTIEHENEQVSFWYNPLDEKVLSYYAKAYYLLGTLYYAGKGPDGSNPTKAIAMLRMADRLGYEDKKHPEQTARELINKIEGESQETTGVNDSYIEIRDLGKRGKMGRFDIYVHHADGTESNVRFGTDRRKFCYLLLLLLISNKDSVQGLMARFFCYGRERLVSLARISLLADEEGPEKWIEKFIYDNEYDKENKQWRYTYTNWMYSNELRKASDLFKEVCSDEEMELYKIRSTGGRDSIASIAVSPEQIVIPDSLDLYTKGLPTRDFMLKYKSVSRRSQDFSMAKKLNPNKYEEWDEETGPIDLLSE
jgi:TPR repeat protein